jgi:hypothetical protein
MWLECIDSGAASEASMAQDETKKKKPNGRGWGGPAKGASQLPKSIQNHPPFTSTNNPAGRKSFRSMTRAERLEACKEVWWRVMHDPDEPGTARTIAADKFYDREDGKAVQKIVTPQTGPAWFIVGEAEAGSVEEWSKKAIEHMNPTGHGD